MLSYKIPQNVQVEDKIFGNILTLKELLYLGVGGGISYVIYTYLARTYILGYMATGLICVPFLISLAFAFLKINDIPLLKFVLLFIEWSLKPHKRIWNKEVVSSIKQSIPKVKSTAGVVAQSDDLNRSDIREISKKLDFGELQKPQGREKIYGEINP